MWFINDFIRINGICIELSVIFLTVLYSSQTIHWTNVNCYQNLDFYRDAQMANLLIALTLRLAFHFFLEVKRTSNCWWLNGSESLSVSTWKWKPACEHTWAKVMGQWGVESTCVSKWCFQSSRTNWIRSISTDSECLKTVYLPYTLLISGWGFLLASSYKSTHQVSVGKKLLWILVAQCWCFFFFFNPVLHCTKWVLLRHHCFTYWSHDKPDSSCLSVLLLWRHTMVMTILIK